MKTDIQIAQEATMLPITEIAEQVGLTPDDLEMYGKYKAKLSDECMERLAKEEDGKLVKVERSHWEVDVNIPIFKGDGREYIEQLLEPEE